MPLRTTAAAAAVAVLLVAAPGAAAQPISPEPPPEALLVAGGAGDDLDPHVDGERIAWTHTPDNASASVRWTDLPDLVPSAFPQPAGTFDFLPDASAGRIAFTRVVGQTESVVLVGTPGGALERVAPAPANARAAALGGDVVVWQDFTITGNTLAPQMRVRELAAGITTTLAPAPETLNRHAAIAPDGSAVAWSRCATDGSACDIMVARRQGPGDWAVERLATQDASETAPSLDGEWLVFQRSSGATTGAPVSVHARPLAGGPERTFDVPGTAVGPAVRHGFVALAHREVDGRQFDVLAWDLHDDEVRRLTATPENEALGDVDVMGGRVRVAWSRLAADFDVLTTSFDREPPAGPVLVATVRPPVDADGSSRFRASRGVVPLKFALTRDGAATCELPPARLRIVREGDGGTVVDEAVWSSAADEGGTFRVQDCQYHYNVAAARLGPGRYRAEVLVDGDVVGRAVFTLA